MADQSQTRVAPSGDEIGTAPICGETCHKKILNDQWSKVIEIGSSNAQVQ